MFKTDGHTVQVIIGETCDKHGVNVPAQFSVLEGRLYFCEHCALYGVAKELALLPLVTTAYTTVPAASSRRPVHLHG